jgi:hypothetical protein
MKGQNCHVQTAAACIIQIWNGNVSFENRAERTKGAVRMIAGKISAMVGIMHRHEKII